MTIPLRHSNIFFGFNATVIINRAGLSLWAKLLPSFIIYCHTNCRSQSIFKYIYIDMTKQHALLCLGWMRVRDSRIRVSHVRMGKEYMPHTHTKHVVWKNVTQIGNNINHSAGKRTWIHIFTKPTPNGIIVRVWSGMDWLLGISTCIIILSWVVIDSGSSTIVCLARTVCIARRLNALHIKWCLLYCVFTLIVLRLVGITWYTFWWSYTLWI